MPSVSAPRTTSPGPSAIRVPRRTRRAPEPAIRSRSARCAPGTVTVDDEGVTTFHHDPSGHVRLVVDADLDQVAEEIVARIERAGTTATPS
ncbi:hypothetical protein [Streptomyces tendae]|uniref:hypothetical protein n=1 Tax=Streptomyces tendae TaxID=1932 RepID=UPI0037137631